MEYREFVLKGDINQLEYVTFRVTLQEMKPAAWENLMDMPLELFYNVLVRAAVTAGWVADVVEENKYGETETWAWNMDYVDSLPAGLEPISSWGSAVFERWVEIKTLDPN